jgi:hypothetical protein
MKRPVFNILKYVGLLVHYSCSMTTSVKKALLNILYYRNTLSRFSGKSRCLLPKLSAVFFSSPLMLSNDTSRLKFNVVSHG